MSYYGKSLYLDFENLPRVDHRFSLGRVLARGISAKICQGVDHDNDNRLVAIKILGNLSENYEVIEEEYRIFKDLSRHDNFPHFYGAYLNKFDKEIKDEIWLVMEYCQGGSVGDLLYNMSQKNRKLTEPLIGYILREVINALSYLHMNHIVHRDVKACNILVTEDGQVKLTDFGFSRHLKHTMSRRSTSIGSPHWMAPEVISSTPEPQELLDEQDTKKGYDHHCDIWSLGITAIELADGEPPLWKLHPVRALFQIVHNPPPEVRVPSEWSSNFKDFISECLIKNPEHRPVAMELVDHPFIQEIPEDTGMLQNQLKVLVAKHSTSVDLDRPMETIAKNGRLRNEPEGAFKKMYADDLAALDVVDEDRVLLTLGNRFSRGQFQTYAGTVLLVINPQTDTAVYDKTHHDRYMLKSRSDEEPHIFGVADRAWQDMLHHKEHQNIILSGDRNSGKSFNFCQIIRHMCIMAKGNAMVAQRIEQLPMLLDSFGNAATDGNANSSRHVRYLELKFTDSGKLSGAVVNMYLLEKWRICDSLTKSNRNYHIFYYVYYGLKQDRLASQYFLEGRNSFRFLPIGDTDAEINYYLSGYQKLKEHLIFWDMEKVEQEFIFQTIAAILLIGQINFDDENGSAFVSNPNVLNDVGTLLSVNPAKLGWALCNNTKMVGGDIESSPNDVLQAESIRDALARGIYSRLVDWLINCLNINMCLGRKVFGEKNTMGILDPPGFDTTTRRNSFEQLISNVTNEQLSYHYNQNIFSWEMQDYKDEGIRMGNFSFKDNRETLNAMLSKPDGLLAVIDEQSRMADSDADTLLDALQKTISGEHLNTESEGTFVIHHSAGDVRYRAEDFLERNRDYLPADLITVMRNSKNPRLASIFLNKMTKTGHVTSDPTASWSAGKTHDGKNKGFNTVSQGQFSQTRQMQTIAMKTRQSLIQLLQKLVHGTPHFVRCIRKNTTASSSVALDKNYLTDQIRACNLIDTIRIRQRGFSHRIPFEEFLRRYQFLAFDFEETVDMSSENCRLLLLRLKMEGWMIGKTKVFLKYYAEEYLSRLYESQVRKIIKVQAIMRAVMAKLRRKRGDNFGRSHRRSRSAASMSKDEAAVAIQKSYRGYSVRKEYGCAPTKAKRFQCNTIQEEAANTIQYFWRKWKGKSLFQQLLFYRADKQQQLTYFCQQVHVYNQEFCGSVRNSAKPVEVSLINITKRKPFTSSPQPPRAKKLPLILKNRHFLDTTFMCIAAIDRSKLVVNPRPNNLAVPSASSANRNNRTPSPSSSSPTVPSRSILKNSNSPTPANRNPSPRPVPVSPAPVKRATPTSDNDNVTSSVKVNVQVSQWNGKQPTSPTTPTYGLSKPIGPKINVQPYTGLSMAKPADQRQIAKEIERKAVELGKTDAVDDAPFNFQGMLKKTSYSRGSMKRGKNGQLNGENENSTSSAGNNSSPVVYQSKPSSFSYNLKPVKYQAPQTPSSPSPNKHQIAPGLVIEGEEADL